MSTQLDQDIKHVWHEVTKREYRGFRITDDYTCQAIDHFYRQLEYPFLTHLDVALASHKLEKRMEKIIEDISQMSLGQLHIELIKCDQCEQNWQDVFDANMDSIMVLSDLSCELLLWMYTTKEIFYKLVEHYLNLLSRAGNSMSTVFSLLDLIRNEQHSFIIRSWVFGYHKYQKTLIEKLLELIHQGLFEAWVVFDSIFPLFSNLGIYPIMDCSGPYYDPNRFTSVFQAGFVAFTNYKLDFLRISNV